MVAMSSSNRAQHRRSNRSLQSLTYSVVPPCAPSCLRDEPTAIALTVEGGTKNRPIISSYIKKEWGDRLPSIGPKTLPSPSRVVNRHIAHRVF